MCSNMARVTTGSYQVSYKSVDGLEMLLLKIEHSLATGLQTTVMGTS